MKPNRFGVALSLLAAGTLMLSACGSDENTSTGSGGTSGGGTAGDVAGADCSGKKALKASGSTAQPTR